MKLAWWMGGVGDGESCIGGNGRRRPPAGAWYAAMMTPVEAVKRLLAQNYEVDGRPVRASVIRPDEPDVFERAQEQLALPVPLEIEGLWTLGAGVRIGNTELRWDGSMGGQYLDEAFPEIWP